jgi:hypothetical protein
MDFYSNVEIIPHGESIDVTENNWTEIHWENYLIFEIINGIVITELDLNYKQLKRLKRKQFKSFKKTYEYQKAIESETENFEARSIPASKANSKDELLSKSEIFEKLPELKLDVREITEDDENKIGNWRIQLDIKTSRKKLKEIEKFIRENVNEML